MKDEPKRARRRRDLARMKAKARRIRPDQPRAAWRADYLAVCSCWMCGNPRRWWRELTMQERRSTEQGSSYDNRTDLMTAALIPAAIECPECQAIAEVSPPGVDLAIGCNQRDVARCKTPPLLAAHPFHVCAHMRAAIDRHLPGRFPRQS